MPSGAADKILSWNTDAELMGEQEFKVRLRALVASPVEIVLTTNRSSVVSVRTGRGGVRVLRVQHAFRAADARTLEAVARFALSPDDWSRSRIDRFVAENQRLFQLFSRPVRRSRPCVSRGAHRDLSEVLARVARIHGLDVRLPAVTWSNGRPLAKGRCSIRFGSYSNKTRTISIHPVLDSPEVPEYFVEYIVYHELLHVLVPPVRGAGGRRDVHNAEFLRRERLFYRYREARNYERRFVRERLGG